MTLDIVIPMAGEGKRFKEAGYLFPKPFIDVNGKPMIARVMDSITPSCEHKFQLLDRAQVGHTEGAVDTLLRADLGDNPVLVANCDQLIDFPIDDFLTFANGDSALVTFTAQNPAHSYVLCDMENRVTCIAEKQVISDEAVVGIYYFRSGDLLKEYAELTIVGNQRFKGEFYVSSMLTLMIDDGLRIGAYRAPNDQIHMLGTPEELTAYLEST